MNITPQLQRIEKRLEIHNDVRIDNYYWLNQENPKVISYLDRKINTKSQNLSQLKNFKEII